MLSALKDVLMPCKVTINSCSLASTDRKRDGSSLCSLGVFFCQNLQNLEEKRPLGTHKLRLTAPWRPHSLDATCSKHFSQISHSPLLFPVISFSTFNKLYCPQSKHKDTLKSELLLFLQVSVASTGTCACSSCFDSSHRTGLHIVNLCSPSAKFSSSSILPAEHWQIQ